MVNLPSSFELLNKVFYSPALSLPHVNQHSARQCTKSMLTRSSGNPSAEGAGESILEPGRLFVADLSSIKALAIFSDNSS